MPTQNPSANAWHPRISANGICFGDADLATQARYWRQLGASRISLIGLQLSPDNTGGVKADLQARGAAVETIVHPFMPFAHLRRDPATWVRPREQLNATIDTAATLGANSIYMLSGGHGDLTWEQAADVFCAALAPCVTHAKTRGIPLLVENATLQNADIHIAHSLRDTLQLAEQGNIGVCIDLFACWAEAGLKATIERAIPRCGLVQVSDYVYGDRAPMGRAVPGDGNIPLERLLDWTLSAGYQGTFDLELLGPRIADEGYLAATARAADRLGEILSSLGA